MGPILAEEGEAAVHLVRLGRLLPPCALTHGLPDLHGASEGRQAIALCAALGTVSGLYIFERQCLHFP